MPKEERRDSVRHSHLNTGRPVLRPKTGRPFNNTVRQKQCKKYPPNFMSYSLHIVRGPDWFDNSEHQVSPQEWTAYIESDPDLERINLHSAHSVDAKLKADDPGDGQLLSLSSGSISSDYPQPPLLKKMFEIAKHFNGYVVSDDGDIFSLGEDGKIRMEAP
jgi:hypothetical protein